MASVLQLTRRLIERPVPEPVSGLVLRTYAGPDDCPRFLSLRERAFARQSVGIRSWDSADFAVEYLEKPWWRPEHLWLVEAADAAAAAGDPPLLGSVTLALRGSGTGAQAVVHWLMVDPWVRRRGLGRWLLATLESRAWDLGFREVSLETHAAWTAAGRLYERHGYRPAPQGAGSTGGS